MLLTGFVAAIAGCSPPQGGPLTNARNAPFLVAGISGIERICQLTGPGAFNETSSVKVAGTDLGSMFEADGRTWFAFGDTFGERATDAFGGGGGIWRSNTMAWTTDTDPSDCLALDGWVTDDVGWAKELVPARRRDGDEITVIPTYGFEAAGAMYLHFMSVRHWADPGEWETNFAGLAKSTDAGQTWEALPGVTWPGTGSFQQVSVAKVDGELYMWGIPAGRLGGVQLMKVAEKEVEQLTSYQYFAGPAADGEPTWSADAGDAKQVIDRQTGELSVIWDADLGRWLMSTMADNSDAVLYEGITPWGPWSSAIPLFTQEELPGLYAPFLNAGFVADKGRTIYFGISVWGPYNVFWYRARLSGGS